MIRGREKVRGKSKEQKDKRETLHMESREKRVRGKGNERRDSCSLIWIHGVHDRRK